MHAASVSDGKRVRWPMQGWRWGLHCAAARCGGLQRGRQWGQQPTVGRFSGPPAPISVRPAVQWRPIVSNRGLDAGQRVHVPSDRNHDLTPAPGHAPTAKVQTKRSRRCSRGGSRASLFHPSPSIANPLRGRTCFTYPYLPVQSIFIIWTLVMFRYIYIRVQDIREPALEEAARLLKLLCPPVFVPASVSPPSPRLLHSSLARHIACRLTRRAYVY